MSAKQRTRLAGGTAKRAETETAAFGEAAISCIDSTMSASGGQVPRSQVSKFLKHGKAAAIPGRDLAAMLGLDDLRELTKLVERERAAGCPIGATCDSRGPGYYLCSGPDELLDYIKALDRRLHNVRKTRACLADTLEKMSGQRRLW